MKPKLITIARGPLGTRGFRSRTAVWIATVVIGVCTTVRLDAVVIDDFNDPTPKWTGSNYPGAPCDPPAVMELADQELGGAIADDPIGIMARGWRDPSHQFPGDSNGYIGGIALHPPGKACLFVFDGVTRDPGGPEFSVDPEAGYRLQFSNMGNQSSVRLVNLTTNQKPEERVKTATRFQQGFLGLFIQANSSSYSFTLDNFFVTGTKP